MDAFAALEDSIRERQRHGPVLAVGDFNKSIRYRRACETAVFGPHLYSPLAAQRRQSAQPPIADHADPPLMERGDPPNRDLLAQLCLGTQLAVRQTFLQKDQAAKVTFYSKGVPVPRQGGVDYAVHKELDHTLISIGYQRNLHDIRSRQHLQVGRTTLFI